MYVEAYETLSNESKFFLQHALFCHVCNRSVYIISVKARISSNSTRNTDFNNETSRVKDTC